jgi:hypothetical protein
MGLKPSTQLAALIRRLRPDIVHSLEFQHAGYLTLAAQEQLKGQGPLWMVSNWGSDIYYFGRDPGHAAKIRKILGRADHYCCECQRDIQIGREFGFTRTVGPVLPSGGGYHLDRMELHRQPGPTSARRLVLLKGYQNWAGRALVGLEALRRCADVLRDYQIRV